MQIAILGYGEQGRSALEYWGQKNDVTVCDQKDIDVPGNVAKQIGQGYLDDLDRFDLIVRSPSIHPDDIVAANSEHILRKVTTVTEEFFRVCPALVIGVTGTKGKGTTSTLITKILEAAGKKVHLGGNIGIPPLDMLKDDIQSQDYVVLELANFQLIDLHFSPMIAVCLMVAPEHLDWHKDIAEYIKSKQQLFRYQTDDALAIFNRINDLSTEVVSVSPALKISYEVPAEDQKPQEKTGAYVDGDTIFYEDTPVCKVSEVQLLGRHNLENVCAAIAATWKLVDGNTAAITKAIQDFKGLPHRLEKVRTVSEITYYNDSFAATPDAAAAAVMAIPGPKVMIVGGFDRGLSFDVLAKQIEANSDKIHHVVAIGQTGPRLSDSIKASGYSDVTVSDKKTMQAIVDQAKSFAQPGDSIVLSPGCASFDMFKNFEDRGLQYKDCVNKL